MTIGRNQLIKTIDALGEFTQLEDGSWAYEGLPAIALRAIADELDRRNKVALTSPESAALQAEIAIKKAEMAELREKIESMENTAWEKSE